MRVSETTEDDRAGGGDDLAGRLSAEERRMADDVAGLAIQKLRAHRVPGRRRVAQRRWAAAHRARWVRGLYGEQVPEQVLRRLDVLLAMRGVG